MPVRLPYLAHAARLRRAPRGPARATLLRGALRLPSLRQPCPGCLLARLGGGGDGLGGSRSTENGDGPGGRGRSVGCDSGEAEGDAESALCVSAHTMVRAAAEAEAAHAVVPARLLPAHHLLAMRAFDTARRVDWWRLGRRVAEAYVA